MATLLIGGSSSHCSNCRRDASPHEDGHFTLLGYGPDNGKPGCGEPWDKAVYVYHAGYRYTAENVTRPGFSDHVNELLIAEYTDKD